MTNKNSDRRYDLGINGHEYICGLKLNQEFNKSNYL